MGKPAQRGRNVRFRYNPNPLGYPITLGYPKPLGYHNPLGYPSLPNNLPKKGVDEIEDTFRAT